MRPLAAFLILTALTALPRVAGADTLRCDGRLVDSGDLAIEVIDACGEPDLVDRWEADPHHHHHFLPDVEEWTYNFGPGRLLYILRFRGGRLVTIDTAGHGFSEETVASCTPDKLVPSFTKYRLLQLCGPPDQRERVFLLRSELEHPTAVVTPIRREIWIYNFGDRHLLREITLENGRIVEIDTRGRGFDR